MKSLLFWTGFLSQTLNYYLFFPDKFKLQPQVHKVTLLLSENKRRLLRWKLQHHFKKCEKNKITGSGIFFFNSLNIFSNKKQMEEAYFPCYQLSGRLAALCCAAEAVVMAISAVVQDLQFGFFLTMTVMSWVGFFFFSSPVACLTWLFSDPLLSLVSAEQKLNLQLMEGRGPWCDTLSRRWCAEYSGSTLSFTSDPFCPWRSQEQLSMLMTTGSHFKIQVKHRGGKISRLRTEGFFFFLFFFSVKFVPWTFRANFIFSVSLEL